MAELAALLDTANGGPAFEQLVATLTSADNVQRGAAEKVYEQCKEHPPQCTQQLTRVLRTSANTQARGLAAVLLRKLVSKSVSVPGNEESVTLWDRLDAPTQSAVKAELLKHLQEEPEASILHKVCDAVSEIGSIVIDANGWPELLPFMFACVQGTNPLHRESALRIFAQLSEELAEPLRSHLPALASTLGQCMAAGVAFPVRLAALRATTNFILTLEGDKSCDVFQNLLPSMLETLTGALNGGQEVEAQEVLEALIEVADSHPRFLRKQLESVLNTMVLVAEAENLEDGTRCQAVEFLLTLAEAREKAPGMLRKAPLFVQRLFSCLLTFLLDVEEDQEWYTMEDEDSGDVGAGERYEVGQEGLDRLAIAMGGKTILPLASAVLPNLLGEASWEKRHAALIALSQIAEGCSKQMLSQLGAVTEMMVRFVLDKHPRVRWAAIHAIGQTCTDLGPNLQDEQHQQLLPALLKVMEDTGTPRVQAHASAAVVNFSENCTPEIMKPYMDALIGKLIVLLQSGNKLVMEGALTALASVADCAQVEFVKYYDAVIPFLTNILTTATDKTARMLRAKSMECISLVGMAVGKERFREDAKGVMQVLVGLQATQMEDDDPTISYMLQAWARLCKCLGQEFLPYLPTVMPPLLHSADLKADLKVTNADEAGEHDEDDDYEVIELGDKRISIRTSVLEEKATACNMLYCYANELKEGFYPYVEPVMQLMLPLLKFYVHEEVRKAAVTALPELVNDAFLAVQNPQVATDPAHDARWVKAMLDAVLAGLCEAALKEPDTEIVAAMLEAVKETIDYAGELLQADPATMAKQMEALTQVFQHVLRSAAERAAERRERTNTEDFDEEELEALQEEAATDTDLYDQLAECLTSFMKRYRVAFLPVMDQLMPGVLPMLAEGAGKHHADTADERRFALCLFDDIIEHCNEGGAAHRYLESFLPHVLRCCGHKDADVRQAAVYGLGVVAQHGGDAVAPHVPQMLQQLYGVVQKPGAREGDSHMATDNAVSAVGKLVEFQRPHVDAPALLGAWLGYLPMREDTEEACQVHATLLRWAEGGDVALLGASQERLPAVLEVLLAVHGTKLVDEATGARIQAMAASLPATSPVAAALTPIAQQKLAALRG